MSFRPWLVLAFLSLVNAGWGAVTSEVARSDYVGNGASAAYSTTFPVKATSEVRVFTQDADGQDVELALGADYSAVLSTAGLCTITLTDGNLANGYKLSLQRGIPYTQTYNPTLSGAYNAASLGTALDRLSMEVIRLKGDVARSIKVPYLEAGGDTVTKLEAPAAERVGQSIVFGSSGEAMVGATVDGVAASAFAQTLLDDTTADAARTTLGIPSQAMAARTVVANDTAGAANGAATSIDALTLASDIGGARVDLSARAAWRVSVKDFAGVTGDGTTDDTTAIQAGITTLLATSRGPGFLYWPKGIYRVSTLSINCANASIAFQGEGEDCTIIQKIGSSTDPVLNFFSAVNAKRVVVSDLEVDANNVTNCDAIRMTSVPGFYLRNVRAWKARTAIDVVGSLLGKFESVTARNSATGFKFRDDPVLTCHPNAIRMDSCRALGCTSWGLDFGKGSGLIVDTLDVEGCGTAANTGTGGIIIRDTIDDENGFGRVSLKNTWLESNLGWSVYLEGAAGGQVDIDSMNITAPESTRALNASAGLRHLALADLISASTNDAVTVAAENFFARNCRLYTLTNSATNYSLHNVKTSALDALTTIKTASAGADINVGTASVTSKNSPKAIVKFDGTIGSPTAVFNYNISGITKNGTGDYTVGYESAISNQAVLVTAFKVGSGAVAARFISSGANSYRFLVVNLADVAVDADEITVVTYGQ